MTKIQTYRRMLKAKKAIHKTKRQKELSFKKDERGNNKEKYELRKNC
jgi:hypothetical protein